MSDNLRGGPKGGKIVDSMGAQAAGSILVFLVFIEIVSGFVQGFYTPLLPDIAGHLGVTTAAMNWFQTAQAMAAAVFVPLLSRMGDMYGPRRILRIAIVLVLIGTLIIALAPSYPLVLFGRVLVGPLGAWMPLAIAIIYARTSGASVTRSISIISASLMGGIVLGTAVAGIAERIIPTLTLTLLLPVAMVAISVYAVFFKLPENGELYPGYLDWTGFAGLGIFMVTLILALAYMGPTHAVTSLIFFAISAVCFALWVWWERRTPDPAVDLEIVTSSSMGPLYLTAFLLGIIMIDAPPNLSDFLSRDPEIYDYGFAASPELLSAMIATMLVFATVGAFFSSFVAARIGLRHTLVGAALIGALGQALLLPFPRIIGVFWISGILIGLGLGVLVGTLPALVARAAPPGRTGIANGIYASLLSMGGAVGGAVFRQVLAAFYDENRVSTLGGYMTIWGICLAVFLVAAFMMARVSLPAESEKKTHHK